MSPAGRERERRHSLENCVQPRHTATADAHLAQKQIGEHAQQREHANHHYPRDSGSRVAMGPKQDPRDDRQLEQRDECDSKQRVVERGDHAYRLDAAYYPMRNALAQKLQIRSRLLVTSLSSSFRGREPPE